MIYKLSVMLAILNRGVTADYKVKCTDGTTNTFTDGYGGAFTCGEICKCGKYASGFGFDFCGKYASCFAFDPGTNGDVMECATKYAPGAMANYFKTTECADASAADCKCVEEVVVVASTTEKATEPPTTEAPTKMSTEPPTSGAPAKASTKAPTDAPTKAPTTTTTTTTAAPTTTTTTTTASPGLALPWPKYPGRNCYWKNHGAEEVDYPWGKAVAKVNTLHACQAACVEAADFGCHGVLFQVATGNCYRKKDIVVEKCVRDESVDLYVRPSATVFVDRLE